MAAIQAELAALKDQVSEQKRVSEFWFNKANNNAAAPPPPPEPKAEPEEDVDVLDVLTTKGAAGLDAILAKRGYVRADQVNATVNAKAQQLATENELLTAYPDLRDKNSEFFRQTAVAYGELKSQGVPEATAMRLAAQQVELNGIKSGKVKTPQQKADDAKTQRETERQARIRAQAGDRTNSRTPESAEPDDDELSDAERRICVGMGITEESYKKRVRSGTQIWGGVRGGGKK